MTVAVLVGMEKGGQVVERGNDGGGDCQCKTWPSVREGIMAREKTSQNGPSVTIGR